MMELHPDRIEDASQIGADILVLHPHDGKAGLFQDVGPGRVPGDFGSASMCGAVDLDDQPGVKTDEIDNEARNLVLPAELATVEAMSAQRPPKRCFG